MIRSDRAPSQPAPRRALLLVLLLAACGPAAPSASASPSAAPAADEGPARHAVEVALASLSKRSFNVSACVATGLRVVTEAEAAAGPGGGDGCSVLVAHRADRTWLVIVRSPSQPGKVWAVVTVTAGGEGVAHIDYKP